MALTIQKPTFTDLPNAADQPALELAADAIPSARSRARAGFGVMAAAIVLVLAATTTMMLVMTDVPLAAALGLGLYCAFWLGIGFGTIFGAAAAFGRDH